MFVIAMVMACGKFFFFQDTQIFKVIVQALFDSVKNGFELILGLVGALCLWMGIMNIGEKSGVVTLLSRLVNPLFRRLFPEIPKEAPLE